MKTNVKMFICFAALAMFASVAAKKENPESRMYFL